MSDTPMARRLFIEMLPVEQERFVASLQERRLRIVETYKQLVAERDAAQLEQWRTKLNDQLRMVERDIATCERAMEKIEGRCNKIAALRAAIGG